MKPSQPVASTRKSITLTDALWHEIAKWRFGAHIPTEVEAVRRLLEAGLRAETAKEKRKERTL